MAMRNFQMKRQRGRNRGGNQAGGGGKPQQNANRAFDSTGPENIKVRGHAQHVYEKYQSLARDAASAGDRVLAENYLQHAEHYFRTIQALQPNKPVTEIVGRETFTSGFDIDFEDEGVAAAIEATAAAALEREQNGGGAVQAEAANEGGEAAQGQGQGGQGQPNQGGQNRQWEPRPPRNDRYQNERYQGDRPQNDRYQNDRPQGGQQGDRPRYENRDRDDRQGGDRQQGDRPRYENRDRPYRDRDDRQQGGQAQGGQQQGGERPRYDREDRQQGGDRQQGDRPRYERERDRDRGERNDRVEPAADVSSPTVAPTLEGSPAPAAAAPPVLSARARMLRSEDGGVSHAPAFLNVGAAPAPSAEGDEAPKPRRRRAKPKTEDAPESSED